MDVNELISVSLMKFMAGKWPKWILFELCTSNTEATKTDNGIRYELICHIKHIVRKHVDHNNDDELQFFLFKFSAGDRMCWAERCRALLALKMIHYKYLFI